MKLWNYVYPPLAGFAYMLEARTSAPVGRVQNVCYAEVLKAGHVIALPL